MMTKSKMPVLYSYRRCPYAMRARMALKLANINVEIREISLREKPPHMLQVSPKGTVPVLVFADGKVIEESIEIMFFAFKTHALGANIHAGAAEMIVQNDTHFKLSLDAYKYPEKSPTRTQLEYRQQGEVFLQKLENLLLQNSYLLSEQYSMADIAIFPFIRQFAAVDATWFAQSDYAKLRNWLNAWVESDLFKSIMQKQAPYTDK
jgi:glutathione S-transferase